ncbi:Ferritin-like metal-binding protein YciE [Catalinimonas alkaloidigena]|uniref:Ferritin-like metal-binding protein YciE n=1 Tax=Catalinimonas alkaloidigena TaxID=1075417 RepID=A0A1G8XFQ1_9BACT|nr:ferritin-like domain-containing protein [Catalinimonas alkaloidigena]SDJ89323.1 Ferritin-like metal-binding protein YciE [Catalinimonas alkaloidigena]
MKLESLRDLFVDQLRDLYSAENQLLKALPKMRDKATDPNLKKSFDKHYQETQGQVEKLEKAFDLLGEKASGHKCKAMAGIIAEAEELMDAKAPDEVMDAGLIAEAQRVEHYEIAGYGTVRSFAEQLGEKQVLQLINEILRQEKNTDQKLTQAATQINPQAEAATH